MGYRFGARRDMKPKRVLRDRDGKADGRCERGSLRSMCQGTIIGLCARRGYDRRRQARWILPGLVQRRGAIWSPAWRTYQETSNSRTRGSPRWTVPPPPPLPSGHVRIRICGNPRVKVGAGSGAQSRAAVLVDARVSTAESVVTHGADERPLNWAERSPRAGHADYCQKAQELAATVRFSALKASIPFRHVLLRHQKFLLPGRIIWRMMAFQLLPLPPSAAGLRRTYDLTTRRQF